MKELLISRILTATPEELVAVKAVFNGKIESNPMPPVSTRMFDNGQAAKSLGVSRQTVRRMIAAGRLPTVEIRAGRFRVPEQEIIKLVATATAKGDRA